MKRFTPESLKPPSNGTAIHSPDSSPVVSRNHATRPPSPVIVQWITPIGSSDTRRRVAAARSHA